MPAYSYKARDRSGKLVEAVMEAATQRDVASNLREKGLVPTEITLPKTGLQGDIKLPAWLDFGGKTNLRDVTVSSVVSSLR